MNRFRTATNATLALTGAALWVLGATKLSAGGDLNFEPNPLGVKMSPYGQVIALAAQGEIDADWHGTEVGSDAVATCPSCGKIHGAAACVKSSGDLVSQVEDAVAERTNPNPASEGHKFYLRRQIEDRLRLAFEFDPSNYANYNAYHFFLTEPQLGTRPVLNDKVLQLAEFTIRYCMREESDPRPALTAASAAGNVLQLMFLHKEDYTIEQMREQLAVMDAAIVRNKALTAHWLDSGDFEKLSPERQQEAADRIAFILKSREAAAGTIARLASPQASR